MSAPDTAADPLPYTPPPANQASAGEQTGLVAVDNGNVAIDVVRGFFEAATTGTGPEIEAFLSERLMITPRGGRRPAVTRDRIARQFMNIRRARGALDLDTLVDLNGLDFVASNAALSLEAGDRAVRVPIGSRGADVLRNVLGWTNTSGVVYVRPRLRQIVGF